MIRQPLSSPILFVLLYFLAGCGTNALAQTEEGFAASADTAMPANPLVARVGVLVDQITSIDQKAENFGVVGTLRIEWDDPRLAYNAIDFDQPFKIYTRGAFTQFADENGLFVPGFVIANQQGRRFSQQADVVVHNHGAATYLERFSVTLQAPDFDFVQYPFDTQTFFVHVDAVFPSEFVTFEADDAFSELGDQLGEEEWIIEDRWTKISQVNGLTGEPSARYSFGFEASRHNNYYVLRIFIPLFIILAVSWLTFTLQDFGKRVDIASANLLIFVAFNFIVSNDLPRLGYLTFMDALFVAFFIFTGIIVVTNVVFRRMEITGREWQARQIDNYTIWIYPVILLILVLTAWWLLVVKALHL